VNATSILHKIRSNIFMRNFNMLKLSFALKNLLLCRWSSFINQFFLLLRSSLNGSSTEPSKLKCFEFRISIFFCFHYNVCLKMRGSCSTFSNSLSSASVRAKSKICVNLKAYRHLRAGPFWTTFRDGTVEGKTLGMWHLGTEFCEIFRKETHQRFKFLNTIWC
jgi:hypothetical protein